MKHEVSPTLTAVLARGRSSIHGYVGASVGFYLLAVCTACAGTSVLLLSPFKSPAISAALVAPIFLLAYSIWLQARRHLELVSAVLLFREDSYILYLRGSDTDDDPLHLGFEDALVRALAPIGPTVIVDSRSVWKRSAAIQVDPFPDSVVWTEEVGRLADTAKLVVLRVGPRRGYRSDSLPRSNQPTFHRGELDGVWLELEQMPAGRFSESCLLFIGQHWDNRSLNAINANGSLYFGPTSVLAEIPKCLPREVAHLWPRKMTPPSRWFWFRSDGKACPLGPPDWRGSRINTKSRVDAEVSPVLQHFGCQGRRLWIWYELLGIIGVMVTAVLASFYFKAALERPIPSIAYAALGMLAATAWLLLHRKSLSIAFRHHVYGEYENFVWPMYFYTQGLPPPIRRKSTS